MAMKILSGRSKDREDVIAIIAAQGPSLNYIRIRETLELLEKALDRSDLVVELERARTEATRRRLDLLQDHDELSTRLEANTPCGPPPE